MTVRGAEKRISDEFHVYAAVDMTPEKVAARRQARELGLAVIDPAPLYTGRAESRNEFVKRLVEAGYSMEGADLRGAILSGCRMEGGNFRNANLENARLNGVRAAGCVFDGARISRTTIGGADLRLASFVGAQIVATDFDKSTLTGASFASADLNRCDFFKTHGANLDMRFASIVDSNFDRSSLSQIDLRGARVSNCSFKRADLRAHADRGFENGKPGRNAPDYTFAAIVAGCDWKDAKISDDHPAALRDAKNGRLGKGLSWLMTSVAVGAGIGIPLDSLGIADMAVQMVGYAGVSIVAVPLVKVATDAIVDALKKGAGDIQENAFDRLRHKIETARVFFAHKKDTLLAFVHRVKAPTVVQAMRAMSRPGEKLGFFDVVGSRDVHLVIADSKNFRVAFQHLILRQDVGRTYRDDVSIMLAEDDEHAPRAMRFMKDGSCAAVWYEGGMPAYVASFDASGAFDPDRSFLPDEIEPPTREEVLEYFQEAVLRHSDAPVPPKTGRFMRLDIDRNGNPIRLPPRAPDVTVTPVRPETVFVDGLENENAESAESERKIVDFNAMAARRSAGPH